MAARQGTLAPHQLTLTRSVCPYLGTICTCLWQFSTLQTYICLPTCSGMMLSSMQHPSHTGSLRGRICWVQGVMGRASTWAAGGMPGSAWSPDMLAGLYYGWNMAPQHPVGHPAALAGQQGPPASAFQQGAAASAFQQGPPGASGATGDWRSVVQAAAAAASQLEISKLSGSKSLRSASLRSADLAGDAPLATQAASFGKAPTAPVANSGAAKLPARLSKVKVSHSYMPGALRQSRLVAQVHQHADLMQLPFMPGTASSMQMDTSLCRCMRANPRRCAVA